MLASLCCRMDKKIRINIQVGDAKYPLWVDPKEEPIYREAARMVNRRMIAYSTKFRGSNLPPEVILAMSAVDLAVLCQKQDQMSNVPNAEAQLSQIINDLRTFLDSPSQPNSEQ